MAPKNSGLERYREKAFSLLKNLDKAKVIELRGEDIPFMVEEYSRKGKNTIGLTGEDLFNEYCVTENSNNLEILERIEWSDPNTLYGKPALCLLGPKDKQLNELAKYLSICISAKYRNMAEKYLKTLEESGFCFRKIYVSGCVETGYSEGIADLAIDIVYSGATMERNGLRVYEKIKESDFVIITAKNEPKPRQSIEGIEKYSPPTDGRRGMLRLDFNENTKGCSEKVIQALKEITADEISAYPEYGKFTSKLAEYLEVNEKELLLTNGSDEAIKLTMDVFIEKGEEVLIPEPTFRLFGIYAQIAGAKISKISYKEDLSFPTDEILEKLDENPKMLVLVNPNNPTGTAIYENDLLKIIDKAKNTVVLLDEAYYQYYGKSAKEKIRQYPNLIILQTFSKAFGLAGLRMGYIIANSKTISLMKKAASPYSVNAVAMKAAEAAMLDTEFIQEYVKEVKKNREAMVKELNDLGVETFPSEANFILAKFGKKAETVRERLLEKSILVRDAGKYPMLEGCLRITIGTTEQCKTSLREIKSALNEEALIFDMDGVLVDVSGSYRVAIQKTVEYFTGKSIAPAEIQEFRELGGNNNDWELTEAILLKRKVKIPKEKIKEKFQEIYEKQGLASAEKALAKSATLAGLKKKFRLGIVTGRPKKEALATLEKFGFLGYFDVIVTDDEIPEGKGKPSPFGIRRAMKILGTKTASYFGDTVDDMEAAARAKIKPIGVIPKSAASEKLWELLVKKGAVKILYDINEAKELII